MKNLSNAIIPFLMLLFSFTLNAQGTGGTGGSTPNSNDDIENLKAIATNEDTTCQARAEAGLQLADILAKRIMNGTDKPNETNLKAISNFYFQAKWDYKCWLNEADDDLKECLKLYFELADLQSKYWEQMIKTLEVIKALKTNAGSEEAFEILKTDILPHLDELDGIQTDAVKAIVKEAKKLQALKKQINEIIAKIPHTHCEEGSGGDDENEDNRPSGNTNTNSDNKNNFPAREKYSNFGQFYGFQINTGIRFNSTLPRVPFVGLKASFPLNGKWGFSASFTFGNVNNLETTIIKVPFGGKVSATGKGQRFEKQQIRSSYVITQTNLQIHYLIFNNSHWAIELHGGTGWIHSSTKQYNFKTDKTVSHLQNFVELQTGAGLHYKISKYFDWTISGGFALAKQNTASYFETGVRIRM